jgi:hypothetical protein
MSPQRLGLRQSRDLHHIPGYACRWSLAPGLDKRGRVMPGTTLGHRRPSSGEPAPEPGTGAPPRTIDRSAFASQASGSRRQWDARIVLIEHRLVEGCELRPASSREPSSSAIACPLKAATHPRPKKSSTNLGCSFSSSERAGGSQRTKATPTSAKRCAWSSTSSACSVRTPLAVVQSTNVFARSAQSPSKSLSTAARIAAGPNSSTRLHW